MHSEKGSVLESSPACMQNAEGIPWKSYGFWTKIGYEDTGERLTTKWNFKIVPFVKNLR